MSDQPPENQADVQGAGNEPVPVVAPQRVPMVFNIAGGRLDSGEPTVILQIQTPVGAMLLLPDPNLARQVGSMLINAADQSEISLIVPGMDASQVLRDLNGKKPPR